MDEKSSVSKTKSKQMKISTKTKLNVLKQQKNCIVEICDKWKNKNETFLFQMRINLWLCECVGLCETFLATTTKEKRTKK